MVRDQFEETGRLLVSDQSAASYDVTESDGVSLTLVRKSDGAVARVEMTGTTEVYFLDLGGIYRVSATAYDPEEKQENLATFLVCATLFMRGNYVEVIRERKGRISSRSIRLGDAGDYEFSGHVSTADRLKGLLGSRTVVRKPHPQSPTSGG
jgi:hypothetical protein